MLGKGRRFELADNGLQAFRQHKTVLITNPLTIHCVGSKDGIGAVLEQKKLNATARWCSNGVRLPCHLFTALYFSHGNASERVNRFLIAAIQAYVSPDQCDWDW